MGTSDPAISELSKDYSNPCHDLRCSTHALPRSSYRDTLATHNTKLFTASSVSIHILHGPLIGAH
jgi:hypothetical protein